MGRWRYGGAGFLVSIPDLLHALADAGDIVAQITSQGMDLGAVMGPPFQFCLKVITEQPQVPSKGDHHWSPIMVLGEWLRH